MNLCRNRLRSKPTGTCSCRSMCSLDPAFLESTNMPANFRSPLKTGRSESTTLSESRFHGPHSQVNEHERVQHDRLIPSVWYKPSSALVHVRHLVFAVVIGLGLPVYALAKPGQHGAR